MDATLDAIEAILRAAPDGVSAVEVGELLDEELTARQVRYRLQALVDAGRARTEGERRWRRYFPVSRPEASQEDGSDAVFGTYAQALMHAVRAPLGDRERVGYDVSLLEEFDPKSSQLLGPDLREELTALGSTPHADAPAGTFARHVMERLVIDLSWASSSLEGNTYSILDTRRLIERGEAAEGKDLRETQMILNHKRAIEFLVEDVHELAPTARVISNLHAVLVENLRADPSDAGRVRSKPVGIAASTYTPISNPQRLQELFHRMLALAREIEDPLEQSFFLFVHIAYLQPFIDGNKRTARLAANMPLIRTNMRPLTFLDIDRDEYLAATLALYEKASVEPLRDIFAWAYERSCARYESVIEVVAEPDPFRLRYRDAIYEVVRDVVAGAPEDPEAQVEDLAADEFDDPAERARFIGFVMADLAGLHEGNFMRYRIKASDFDRWNAE